MFNSFTGKWEQKIDAIKKFQVDLQQDIVHVNDKLVQLDLDVEQLH